MIQTKEQGEGWDREDVYMPNSPGCLQWDLTRKQIILFHT